LLDRNGLKANNDANDHRNKAAVAKDPNACMIVSLMWDENLPHHTKLKNEAWLHASHPRKSHPLAQNGLSFTRKQDKDNRRERPKEERHWRAHETTKFAATSGSTTKLRAMPRTSNVVNHRAL